MVRTLWVALVVLVAVLVGISVWPSESGGAAPVSGLATSAPSLSTATVDPVSDTTEPADPPAAGPSAAVPTSVATRSPGPSTPSARGVWSADFYVAGVERWQNPDFTACTAAAAQSMLNTISVRGATPAGFVWQRSTSYASQESVLAYERAHMTMLASVPGTDPNGWRNALNYFGWSSMGAGVYRDTAFPSFEPAARAAIVAAARYRKPVGILARDGNHAQFLTGYKVIGDDPGTGSTRFTIVGVYLTDPLESAGYRDAWVSYATWKSGTWKLRFGPYSQPTSPYRDPISHLVGKSQWLGKWVIVDPAR